MTSPADAPTGPGFGVLEEAVTKKRRASNAQFSRGVRFETNLTVRLLGTHYVYGYCKGFVDVHCSWVNSLASRGTGNGVYRRLGEAAEWHRARHALAQEQAHGRNRKHPDKLN